MARWRGKFADCTHVYFESSKAWKVTVVWIECDDAVFSYHIKKVHTRNCSPKQKSKFFKQGGKLDFSRYSQVFYLTLCYHWQTLSISILLEM